MRPVLHDRAVSGAFPVGRSSDRPGNLRRDRRASAAGGGGGQPGAGVANPTSRSGSHAAFRVASRRGHLRGRGACGRRKLPEWDRSLTPGGIEFLKSLTGISEHLRAFIELSEELLNVGSLKEYRDIVMRKRSENYTKGCRLFVTTTKRNKSSGLTHGPSIWRRTPAIVRAITRWRSEKGRRVTFGGAADTRLARKQRNSPPNSKLS